MPASIHVSFDRQMAEPNAINHAKFRSRSHAAVIRVYDAAGNVIKTHEHYDGGDQPGRDDCPKRCQAIATVLAGLIRRLGYRRI